MRRHTPPRDYLPRPCLHSLVPAIRDVIATACPGAGFCGSGALGLGGLTLPQLLELEARAGSEDPRTSR